jgi:hypothetical protein
MKTLSLMASAALLFSLSSCNRDELERSNQQRDSLQTVLKERDKDLVDRENSINDFITSFNEVERNLDSVAIKQQIISLHADKVRGDLKANQKDRINSQIRAINTLMDSNRKTIAELKRKLKGSSRTNAKLKETVKMLTERLAQKDQELAALNERLMNLNAQVAMLQTSVDTLTAQNNSRAKVIADNTIAMHTAYYIVGRTKDLKESKLIDRKGGLLGLGKTSRLSANVDNTKFTRIDYTMVSSIPVNSTKVKVITSHPSDSYKLEKDTKNKSLVKTLVITNPEKFWGTSKYLVIEGTPANNNSTASTGLDTKKENKY